MIIMYQTQPKYKQKNTLFIVSTFTGKERDSETGFSYFGARYYDSDLMTGWLSVDPMADKYPSLSPYAYCGWNPVRLVDPDGEEVVCDPYIIFNGKTRKIQIWDDNETPENYSDDTFLGQYNAGNNVSPKDNPLGNWEDGIYPMLDKIEPQKHYDKNGDPKTEIRKGKRILTDSEDGAYGVHGIFRAEPFLQDDGAKREGMGLHAGRSVNNKSVLNSFTRGCIRITPEAMDAIIDAISTFGPLTNVIVQENRSSSKSNEANKIRPGNIIQSVITTIRIKK